MTRLAPATLVTIDSGRLSMSTSAPEDPTSLRSYRLIAEIGRGGMASVYLAVARGPAGFNKLVVIKKTRRDIISDGDVLAMFLDEARLAARMNHPNVVQTYEIGQDGDQYFIAMEYLDGQPYSRVLSRLRAELPLAMHLRVIADLLTGLHHAHELCDFDGTPLGVVHRDATPQNVFITYDGSIKVVDFGIAKALDASSQTRTGVVKGKVAYMAPEQVRGERLDRRADVFAAGVMLWEAVAGRRMWNELPDLSVVHELMYDRVPAITAAITNVPQDLAYVVSRAVAPRRDERYPTALEMHRDLETCLSRSGHRASARDVGEFIAPAFASDRSRVRAVIESQLRDMRWTGVQPRATSSDLPTIEPGPNSGQSSMSSPALSAAGPPPSNAMAAPEPHPVTSPSAHVSVPIGASGPISFAPTNSGAAVPLATRPPSAGRSLVVPAAVATIVSLAVVAVGVKLLARPAPTAPTTPAASATIASASAEPRDAADAVKLVVRARPAEARVYLDDVLVSTGPFEGKVLKSDKPRTVRVEAEGHLPKEERVTLTADIVLSIDLQKSESVRPVTPVKPGPLGPAPTRPGPRPKRDIDSDSPYKQ